MQIEKLDLPKTPVWVLDEFLTPADAAVCLRECIDLRKVYRPASVGAGKQNRRDPEIRRNDVVMLDTIFGVDRQLSDILTLTDRRINDQECNALWNDGFTVFDDINYRTWDESVLSRYGRCNFYGRHQDTIFNPEARDEVRRRIVTLILYLNTEPEQFQGGDLTIWCGSDIHAPSAKIRPRHNRAVIFPSLAFHKVDKVSLPDDAPFSAGRFSLNRWMGFK